jgi:hypothetical protein
VERFEKLLPFISVKINHSGRYCHEMSMEVEVNLFGGPEDLMPDPVGQEFMNWRYDNSAKQRYWSEEKYRVTQARRNHVALWEEQKERWQRKKLKPFQGKDSPKAWVPGQPGPKPEELNLAIPAQPSQEMPAHLRAALDEAEREWAVVEKTAAEFESYLLERIREISGELEKAGYDQIDYLRSREFMEQRIEDRGWKFLEDGRRYKE